jgi:hypothetical protein
MPVVLAIFWIKLKKFTWGRSLLLGIIPSRFLKEGSSSTEEGAPWAAALGAKEAFTAENRKAAITRIKHPFNTHMGSTFLLFNI